MTLKKNVIIILFFILSLIECTPPPAPKYMQQIKPDTPKLVTKGKKPHLAFKRLEDSNVKIENSTATINFHDTYRTIEHQFIIIAQNLQSGTYYPGYSFGFNSPDTTYKDVSTSCEILDNSGKKIECKATSKIETNKITFNFEGNLYNGYQLIANYKYNEINENSQSILYKQEPVSIPMIEGASFCNYKYIIPNGYKNLGLKNNILTKDSESTYSYFKICSDQQLSDEIRFSPKEALWEADINFNAKSTSEFTNDVSMIFPQYYKGGKLKNNYYKIISTENKEYNEKDIIYEDIKYQVTIPGSNKNNVGLEIKTNFTNNLNDEFKADIPEKYYSIDLSNIDQEIQNKAKEIINEKSNLPNYYKIGKFVNSYMNYDISYTGKNLTLKEIYDGKIGVCEHYTLLYNAMLNSIGIKTLYISGWAFDGTQISGNDNTIGHAWTAALIDGKWIELDATLGLFEGISAGHIFKNYYNDIYSYSSVKNSGEIAFNRTQNIKMISESDKKSDDEESDGGGEDDETDKIPIIHVNGYYGKPSFLLLLLCFL